MFSHFTKWTCVGCRVISLQDKPRRYAVCSYSALSFIVPYLIIPTVTQRCSFLVYNYMNTRYHDTFSFNKHRQIPTPCSYIVLFSRLSVRLLVVVFKFISEGAMKFYFLQKFESSFYRNYFDCIIFNSLRSKKGNTQILQKNLTVNRSAPLWSSWVNTLLTIKSCSDMVNSRHFLNK